MLLRQIENNRNRKDVIFPRQFDQGLACFWLHVGRVHHRQSAACKTLADDGVKDVKRVSRDGLIVVVIRDEPSAEI
jgi:hypothetical protein